MLSAVYGFKIKSCLFDGIDSIVEDWIVDQMHIVSSSYFISILIFFYYLPLPENGRVLLVSIDFVYLIDILILCIRIEVYFGKKSNKKTDSVEAN